jgi:type IV pilus assembly protein PilC
MPKFAYIAVDPDGSTVEGARKAETIGSVRAWLKTEQLFPVKISEVKRNFLDVDITTDKLKKRELMHFSRQLAVFIRAGISIITALETISDEAQDKVLRRVLADMVERLNTGSTFADAAAAHPEAFPAYYVGVLRSAELTGRLDETVSNLAKYLDREIQARSKITAALVYPCVVMTLAICTIILLAIVVLPQFRNLFNELHVKLPLATRLLLGLTNALSDFWFLFVGFGVLLVALAIWMQKTEQGRRVRDVVILKLPVIGGIIDYSILERFCRILGTMTSAGVALPDAMGVSSESTNNTVFRVKLEEARQQMLKGGGLARPLIDTDLFPGAARQMMTVGEETGTLDEQLNSAAGYFEGELEVRVRRFTSMFEPATIIFVGVCVGFVAVALVSAMYGMLGAYKS